MSADAGDAIAALGLRFLLDSPYEAAQYGASP